MTMKKAIMCVLMLALAAGIALAQPVEIKIISIGQEEEIRGMQEIIDQFNRSRGDIHVTLERIPGNWGDFNQKLLALIAAGTPPDIARLAGPGQKRFVEANVLYDLTGLIRRDINMAEYYEDVYESIKIDGKIYGIPTGVYTLNVYYNKKMFDEAGIPYPSLDYSKPWTLDEFYATARKLTSGKGATKKYGLYANMDYVRCAPLFFAEGGDLFTPDGKTATLNTRPMINTYKTLQSLIKDGVSPSPTQLRTMPLTQLFMSNRLGMLIDGQWTILPFSSSRGLEFGVAPVPKGSAGAVTLNFIDQWSIMAQSKHPDKAWEVLKHIMSEAGEEVLAKNNLLGMRTNRKVSEAMRDKMFTAISPADRQVFYDSIAHSRSLYYHGIIREEMNTFYWRSMDRIALNALDAEKGLNQINMEWTRILRRQK